MTDTNISNYKECLDEFIRFLDIEDQIVNCNNKKCEIGSHKDILNYLELIIEIMILSASMTVPQKTRTNNIGKYKSKYPGWNQYVKPKRENSILWHKIWKQAGSPTEGQLFEIRRYTRKQYHDAILYVQKNKDNIIKFKVADSLSSKSYRDFWKEIKRLNTVKDNRASIIDNVTGSSRISKIFKDKYENLYNEFEKRSVDESVINDLIRDKCDSNFCNYSHEINTDDVTESVKRLKTGKLDPIYEISTYNIVHGSNKLFDVLAVIFNTMYTHGLTNSNLNKSILIPIPKNKRQSINESSNYRAIALSSIISKMFEYIILDKIQDQIKLNVNQFGYRKNMSTVKCSFIVNQAIQYYKS